MMSFPASLDLVRQRGKNDTSSLYLRRAPHQALQSLRRQPAIMSISKYIQPGSVTAQTTRGHGLEFMLEAKVTQNSKLDIDLPGAHLELIRNSDGSGIVQVSPKLPAGGGGQRRSMPLYTQGDGSVSVHILVDRSSLEVFDRTGGASMTIHSAMCSGGSWQQRVKVWSANQVLNIKSLQLYELNSALSL